MIRQNLGYKLFALVAAIGLWAYVNAERNPATSASLSVLLEAKNVGKGMVVSGLLDEINVTVTGPRQIVEDLSPDQIHLYADMADLEPGTYKKVPVRVALSPEIKDRITVEPALEHVAATMEETISRRLPIEVNFADPQPVGYAVVEQELQPGSALIAGRGSAVKNVKRLVVNVDVGRTSELVESEFRVVAVDRVGNRVAGLEIEPPTARVKIRMRETFSERIVLVSPTITGLPNPPLYVSGIEVMPPSVTVSGRTDRLAAIGTLTTEAIDISGATASVNKTVRLQIPSEVTAAGMRRVLVTIHIKER